jgi:hypothetical protein
MKNKFPTAIRSVRKKGMPTPYTHVQLGKIDILFKRDTIIGIDTPHEIYRTEKTGTEESVFFTLDPKTGWVPVNRNIQEMTEEGILIHLNRLLKEQGENFINESIKERLVGKRR